MTDKSAKIIPLHKASQKDAIRLNPPKFEPLSEEQEEEVIDLLVELLRWAVEQRRKLRKAA